MLVGGKQVVSRAATAATSSNQANRGSALTIQSLPVALSVSHWPGHSVVSKGVV